MLESSLKFKSMTLKTLIMFFIRTLQIGMTYNLVKVDKNQLSLRSNYRQIKLYLGYQNVSKSFTYILVKSLHFRTFFRKKNLHLGNFVKKAYILVTNIFVPLFAYILVLAWKSLHFRNFGPLI